MNYLLEVRIARIRLKFLTVFVFFLIPHLLGSYHFSRTSPQQPSLRIILIHIRKYSKMDSLESHDFPAIERTPE